MYVRPLRRLLNTYVQIRRVERRRCHDHTKKPQKSASTSCLTWCCCPGNKPPSGSCCPPPPSCPQPPNPCPPPRPPICNVRPPCTPPCCEVTRPCQKPCIPPPPPEGFCQPPTCQQPCPGSVPLSCYPRTGPPCSDPCDPCYPCNPCYPCDSPPSTSSPCSGRRCICPPPCCLGGPIPPNPCCPRFPKPNFKRYRLIFAVMLPVIIFQTLNALGHELCPKGPCREFEYMRRRTKRFPWGDGEKSFFHNDHTNHLPGECEPPPLICRPAFDPCDD